MKKILSLFALSLCVSACIYPYTPDIDEAPEGILSVDANITIGDVSTVRLGSLLSLWSDDNPSYADLSDARVWLEDDAGGSYPGTPTNTGYSDYARMTMPSFSLPTENAPADRSYRLCIEALGEKYVSDWTALLEPPVIRDILFTADQEDVTVSVSLEGGPDGTGYCLLSFDETWEFHADYTLNYVVNTEHWTVTLSNEPIPQNYWCWQSASNGFSYPLDYTWMSDDAVTAWPLQRFSRTDNRNHRRYCIRVKAKTLTPASYRFLKALEDNTNGGDNLFSPNPGEIPGNLHCESDPQRMVLGYVTVGQVAWKRAFLDNRFRIYQSPNALFLRFPLAKEYPNYYNNGYLPLIENPNMEYDPTQEGPWGWGPARCYDCTAMGGTTRKPDYWDE